MDWSWFNQLPEGIKYATPVICAGAILIVCKIIGVLGAKLPIGPFVIYNALGIVGIVIGATLIGFFLETHNLVLQWVGITVFAISIAGTVLYDFARWVIWINGWDKDKVAVVAPIDNGAGTTSFGDTSEVADAGHQ